MKKLLGLAAILPLSFMSCSDDDSAPATENEPFFNLVVGNEWVYKRYHVSENGAEYYYGIDTVRVTGQEVIGGETYFKIEHTDDSMLSQFFVQTSRINDEGHLVNTSENVLHPGFDSDYQATLPFLLYGEQIGILDYSSQSSQVISVESNNYTVFPYVGHFTNTIGAPEGEGTRYEYQQGIGLVRGKCRILNDLSYIDYRLVSYNLN